MIARRGPSDACSSRCASISVLVVGLSLVLVDTGGAGKSFAAAPRVAPRHTRATAAGFITNGYTQTTVADFTTNGNTLVDVQADGTIDDGAVTLANARSVSVLVVGEKRPQPTDNPDNRGHIYKFPSGAPGTTQNLDDDFASIRFLPKTMAVGSDGLVYFPETNRFGTIFPQEVTVWDPTNGTQEASNFSTGATIRLQMSNNDARIRVVRADDSGNLYFSPVQDATNARIAKFTISGASHVVSYAAAGQNIEEIRDVAIGGDGRVFAAAKFNPGGGSQEGILYWNADGTFVGSFGTANIDVAQSLGIDRVNNELYVLNPTSPDPTASTNRVAVFNVGGGTPEWARDVTLQSAAVNRINFLFGKLYGSHQNTLGNGGTTSYQFEPDGTRNVVYQAAVSSLIPTMYDIDAVAGPTGSDFVESGTLTSTAITKPAFAHWDTIDFTTNTPPPPNTTLTIDVLDADTGDLLVGNVVSGANLNDLLDGAAGGVAELCRSTIKLRANLTTTNITISPALLDWTVTWTDDDPGETDCNSNEIPDSCDVAGSTSTDCNSNNVPDSCDIAGTTSTDCNVNQVPDDCDIAGSTSTDCGGPGPGQQGTPLGDNPDGIPDECQGGQNLVCDDGQPCTDNVCVPDGGDGICSFPPISGGGACDDTNACTAGEICTNGVCTNGVPVNCDDGDFCTGVETCEPLTGCVSPGNPCTDPTPVCSNGLEDCVQCLQNSDCTDPDFPVCDTSIHSCVGCLQNSDCSALDDPCNVGVCNVSTCEIEPRPPGTSCPDGAFCNGEETCDGAGTCQSPGDPCTGTNRPFCDETNGECVHLPICEVSNRADIDGDGDVDLDDYSILQQCFGGPGQAIPASCPFEFP